MTSDWERVGADAPLLAALRRHHAGSGDPLDQLWWAEHPGEPTPSGTPDPADAVEAARRSLFQRDAGTGAAADVERAASAVATDREAARVALAAAEQERARSTTPPLPPRSRRPTRIVLAGAVVAALLVGGGVGFTTGRFARATAPQALGVFHRAQRADDRPPSVADVPTFITRSTLRYLDSSTTTGVAVYAARTRDERICLIAIVLAARFTATCTTDEGFAASGLSLAIQAAVDPQNDAGFAELQEVHPTWSPAGRVTF